MSEEYNLKFLEEKFGKFDKEYQYPRTSLIEGPLLYIEKESKIDLEKEIVLIKLNESINPTYIWGFVLETNAIYVTRTFGENKVFIYNPTSMKKTDYVKGKLKVLKNLKKDTIDNLFDQKAVFDYFYQKLWDLRLGLGKEIRDKNDIADNIALMEAQHIIDRIIFTYFICEKELVSVKGYGPINGKELFSDIIGQIPDTWGYLKQLFFQQFAKENSDDLDCGGEVFIKTQYLNGGLFRPKEVSGTSEEDLQIDYEWNNIFDPLNKYTWIIEDEIPDLVGDYEGNLTPEIIGHIYEKFVISISELDEIEMDNLNISKSGDLKKGNKKIGAYYTPEHITEYISRNTINPLLFGKLGIIDINIDFNSFLKQSNLETLQKALDVLDEIKICDPACGSGAFLLKTGETLLKYKSKIRIALDLDIDRYSLKKEIIIKNLYGVDIQEGAVEICKLRLWLWLIGSAIDGDVEPLPNIEYNFIVGNSLVGWSKERLSQNILIKVDEKALWTLDALKIGYKPQQIEIIDASMELLNKTDVNSYANCLSLLKGLYSYSAGEKAEILKRTIERIRTVIYKKIDGVFFDYLISNNIKITIDTYNDAGPFHWRVDFKDVFDNGGFDAIIGNPPYIRVQKLDPQQRKLFSKKYESAAGSYDIYILFIERSIEILNDNGRFAFIMPTKFFQADSGSKIRKLILNNSNINQIIDFGTSQVFSEATTYACLFFFTKTRQIHDTFKYLKIKQNPKTIENFVNISKIKGYGSNEEYEFFDVQQKLISPKQWNFLPPQLNNIITKLERMPDKLSDFNTNIFQGITTGADPIFYVKIKKNISNNIVQIENSNGDLFEIEKEILHPLLKGKNIRRFFTDFTDLFIIFLYNIQNNKPILFSQEQLETDFPKTWNYLKKYEDKLKDRENGKWRNRQDWYDHSYRKNLEKFERPKILTQVLANQSSFTLDIDGKYYFVGGGNAGGYGILLNDKLGPDDKKYKYVLALLNSKLLDFHLKSISSKFRGGYFSYAKRFIEQLPIYFATPKEQLPFIKISEKLLQLYELLYENKDVKEEISALENELNNNVYELYDLSDEEIRIIEENTKI